MVLYVLTWIVVGIVILMMAADPSTAYGPSRSNRIAMLVLLVGLLMAVVSAVLI